MFASYLQDDKRQTLDIDIAAVDHLLTTTRTVRKRLDFERPVEPEVLERCIEIAFQAPTGSNEQGWHFLVITDADKRMAIADLYRKGYYDYRASKDQNPPVYPPGDQRAEQRVRVTESSMYLAENMHRAPVLVIPCYEGRVENEGVTAQASFYGSILPATWSLILALRARGLGSAWTTLHLPNEREAAKVLGIPDNVTQTALLPVAYYQGSGFRLAKRLPAREKIYWNGWGATR